MRPYSPGGILNALASTLEGSIPLTSSIHRLRRGLPGYLILFDPHAFGSQCQCWPSYPPSPLVFLLISTYFTTTPGILLSSPTLKLNVSRALPGLSPGLSLPTYKTTYTRFTPNNSEQRLDPSSYRGCWHEVSRSFLLGYHHLFFPQGQSFTTLRPSSLTRRRCIRVSSIVQYSLLLQIGRASCRERVYSSV